MPRIIKASYEETLIKLANAEIEIEGLKDQLDDALSSEDMVVRLTERNLMLGEVYLPFLASSVSYSLSLRIEN